MRGIIIAVVCGFSFIFFQNGTPFFPKNNINTVTILRQGIDDKYRTTTPHIPATDFTRDGLLGMRRKAGATISLFPMKPGNVVNHLKDPSNDLVGANVMLSEDLYGFDFMSALRTYVPGPDRNILNDGFNMNSAMFCEKTNRIFNPSICDGDFDCYRLTIVSKISKPLTPEEEIQFNAEDAAHIRLGSVEVIVKVANPKTNDAKIVSVTPYDPDGTGPLGPEVRLSDELPNFTLNEPTIAGDNRLLVARVGSGLSTYKDENGTIKQTTNTNMVYSVYPTNMSPCDVTQWDDEFHPVSYAHYDADNQMRDRYKFAKYRLTDSMGTPIPRGAEFGGSYPWIDKEAANLFFSAFGTDSFYTAVDGGLRTPYSFLDPQGSLISIDNSIAKPLVSADIGYFEAAGGRTVGISLAGLWTHGRTVLLDGLINNADYNFTISSFRTNSTLTGEVNRQLKLYRLTPANQTLERVGGVREKGDGIDRSKYDRDLTPNSTFLGSLENRLNYHTKIKPITPRDIVWHFGTTRHQDEVVFDDYIDPYFLVNAEMTGALAFDFGNGGNRSMKHFDGFQRGLASTPITNFKLTNTDIQNTNSQIKSPVLFQNAATAPANFLTVPPFGIPVGDVRLEPIAKGGIYGKGVWLEKNSGLSFTVPLQTPGGVLTIGDGLPPERYISVFIDSRFDDRGGLQPQRLFTLVSANATESSVKLVPNSDLRSYNSLIFTIGNQTLAQLVLPADLPINQSTWVHLGIQFFNNNSMPDAYLNGFYIGTFERLVQNTSTLSQIQNFFKPESGGRIILGGTSADASLGIRGWFDDFKFSMRNPTIEEKCNYARGTIVKINNPRASTTSALLAAKYPLRGHRNISTALGEALNGQRYICYTRYSELTAPRQVLNAEPFAHLKNLPEDSTSVRENLLMGSRRLIFDQNRPDFTGNKFCLSCHLQPNYIPFRALNTNALTAGTVAEQDDTRRQPMQPNQHIRGIIPENYFGNGLPATRLKLFEKQKIDQWILRGDR
jgi:hypothetical protein